MNDANQLPHGEPETLPTFVTLTSNVEGATIRFTTDGTEPDLLSDVYCGPLLVRSSATTIRVLTHLKP